MECVESKRHSSEVMKCDLKEGGSPSAERPMDKLWLLLCYNTRKGAGVPVSTLQQFESLTALRSKAVETANCALLLISTVRL